MQVEEKEKEVKRVAKIGFGLEVTARLKKGRRTSRKMVISKLQLSYDRTII